MELIACVNNYWCIGKNNDLLYHLSTDMKFFREKTKDNVIIVGRKTLESFPGGKPLKNRVNIVLTTDKSYYRDDCIIVHSIENVLEEIKKYDDKTIYVCGGEQIYKLFEPFCDTAYITKVNDDLKGDKYFPNLNNIENWILSEESDTITENGYEFKFCTYRNKLSK